MVQWSGRFAESIPRWLLHKKNNNKNQKKNTSCRLSFAIVTIYLIALPLQRTLQQCSPSSNFFILWFTRNRFCCTPLRGSRSRFARISASALMVFSRNPFPLQRNSVCSAVAVFRICRRSLLSAAFSESEIVSSDTKLKGKHRSWGHGIHIITRYSWCHCWRASNGWKNRWWFFALLRVFYNVFHGHLR